VEGHDPTTWEHVRGAGPTCMHALVYAPGSPSEPRTLHTPNTASSGPLRTSTISSGLLQALLIGSSMGSRLLLLAFDAPLHPGQRAVADGAPSQRGGNCQRRRGGSFQIGGLAPASGSDQQAARDELGDEAEHVAFSSAVLGFLVLGLDRIHPAREAALPVELVPDRLAGVAQGEVLVFHIADAGDQGHDNALALDLAGDDVARGPANVPVLAPSRVGARSRHAHGEQGPGLSPRSCDRQRAQPREGRAHGPSVLVSLRVSRRAVSTVKSVTRKD